MTNKRVESIKRKWPEAEVTGAIGRQLEGHGYHQCMHPVVMIGCNIIGNGEQAELMAATRTCLQQHTLACINAQLHVSTHTCL